MRYYLILTDLNNELLPYLDECVLLCLLLLGFDLRCLLYSLSARYCDEILIQYADLDHDSHFDISVLKIGDGQVRSRKIQFSFLIRLYHLHIRRDEILLISNHKFCYRDAYSFHLYAEVIFEYLFPEL